MEQVEARLKFVVVQTTRPRALDVRIGVEPSELGADHCLFGASFSFSFPLSRGLLSSHHFVFVPDPL